MLTMLQLDFQQGSTTLEMQPDSTTAAAKTTHEDILNSGVSGSLDIGEHMSGILAFVCVVTLAISYFWYVTETQGKRRYPARWTKALWLAKSKWRWIRSGMCNVWSTDAAHCMGHNINTDAIDEHNNSQSFKVAILDPEKYPSVQEAVSKLSIDDTLLCPDGICVVRSNLQELYFLLARSDMRDWCAHLAENVFKLTAEQPVPGDKPVSVEGSGEKPSELMRSGMCNVWSADAAYSIGHNIDTDAIDEHNNSQSFKVAILDPEKYPSVQEAVSKLSIDDTVLCPDGICVVRSERQKLYFLLARSDMRDQCAHLAENVFKLTAEQPLPGDKPVSVEESGERPSD